VLVDNNGDTTAEYAVNDYNVYLPNVEISTHEAHSREVFISLLQGLLICTETFFEVQFVILRIGSVFVKVRPMVKKPPIFLDPQTCDEVVEGRRRSAIQTFLPLG
jgi:hypothetical protein